MVANINQNFTKQIKNRRILVVDDEPNIRHVFSTMISFIGFDVDEAENGDKALNCLLKSKFALVLTDLNMPGMDGWTLAYRIKEISPETPVILVTGEEREQVLKKMKDSFVDSILFKPVRLHDVQKTFQSMLDRT